MTGKPNYRKQMLLEIEKVGDARPKLLLHACCAPCATACLEQVKDAFITTAYYYNPNIAPKQEYDKRAQELQKIWDDVLVEEYDSAPFYRASKGKEGEKEGGARCVECFRLRLEKTAETAAAGGYEYISTTLTVSPHKNAQLLNEIGESAAKKHGVKWLPCDFKKNNGYARSVALSRADGLYRQDWCGCEFSRRAVLKAREEGAMKIASSVLDLIGNTPLVYGGAVAKKLGSRANIVYKLEKQNPLSSAKDRVALSMVRAAENSGALQKGGTVIEPTSGNTGIGLAYVCAVLGYKLVLTMPENMSVERIKLVRALGAEIVLTPAESGMQGAVEKANELAKRTPNSIIAGQFENGANPDAHFTSTGPEIWRDTDGKVDAFFACVGTGGTLTGVARYLKGQNAGIKTYGVQPAESPLLTGGTAGSHGIQGIGANFLPQNYDEKVVDGVCDVTTAAAIETARALIKEEGLLVGISSGAAVYAAAVATRGEEWEGKTVVVLLPDTGERYLSTTLFDE